MSRDASGAQPPEPEVGAAPGEGGDAVVEHPLDGVLDLHQFRPADARDVVGDYLDACREVGVMEVRIIHGKGQGVLRRIVHSVLDRRDDISDYGAADDRGNWGVTVVRLAGKAAVVLLLCGVATGCGGAATPGDTSSDPGPAGVGAEAEAEASSEAAGDPEVVSLLGEPLYRPELPDARRAELEANLAVAREAWDANPGDEEAAIWYGRRLAYLSRYNDAIDVYTRGLEQHPDSYRLLRHRGHRYISTRRFDAAIADLRRAAELAADGPVEIEPDGAPNALGIPLSNVHFNIWYHLALAHYLSGDFEAARDAWRQCLQYSDNDDLLVATSDWLYMSYRRLGDEAAAAAILQPIHADMEIIENDAYHRRLLMYRGEVPPEELLDLRATDDPDLALSIATQGYGVGNWYLVNGDAEAARRVFERIVEGSSWAAFGYIAAEADLARGVGG